MRSDTPAASVDILDALLSAPTDDFFPGQEALNRLIRRAASPPSSISTPAKPLTTRPQRRIAPESRPAKRKTTHYIGAVTSDRLDRARDALAAMAAGPNGLPLPRITKSALVEAALELALDVFEAAGGKSPLVHCLQTARDDRKKPSSTG